MEFLLRLLTPCDFPQQRSQGVSMSQHIKMCAHMCWTLDAVHPSGVIQPTYLDVDALPLRTC